MRASALLTILFLSSCVPAHLEKVEMRSARHSEGCAEELARAFSGSQDPAAQNALAEWLGSLSWQDRSQQELQVDANGTRYRVHFRPSARGIYSSRYFDRLESASHYDVRGIAHHHEDGAGAALLGYRRNTGREKIESYYPPEGIYRSVTALATPQGKGEVEITLYNRHQVDVANIGGRQQHLAADLTVPWAALLEHARPLGATGITSVIRQHSNRSAGFYLMEEYDPKRTPVIFIHGLFSTPLAWAQITNEIWADPELRSRYQIWHYLYPTHSAALYSARIMRLQLDQFRHALDPDQKDPAMQRSVVVSHSMGGLLAKTLVTEPDDSYWNAVFTRPLNSLNVTPKEYAALKEAYYWKPRGHVDREIYCSVPFHGSTWATSIVGHVGGLLVAPDKDFQEFYQNLEKKNPGLLRDDYKTFTHGRVTSVLTLTPKQKSIGLLADMHPVPGVTSHTISGAHDLFVSRESSTIPYADSALVVNTGHGSFHDPKAVQEILRILRLPPVSASSGARKTGVSRTR